LGEAVIRKARKEDARAIHSLVHAVRINPLNLDWRRFLVAVSPLGELLGCGQIKPHKDGSLELASIAVRELYRKQGLARLIIQSLITNEEKRPLFLMCRTKLGSFYVKFGFRSIGQLEMPDYFKRVSQLGRILNANANLEDRLLVMRLD
jgi:N-acetylglutamate synthase-like GNAT family acetyltransferase